MKKVTEEWIEEWWEDKFSAGLKNGLTIDADLLKQMFEEAGVEVVKTASNARDAYGGYREDK